MIEHCIGIDDMGEGRLVMPQDLNLTGWQVRLAPGGFTLEDMHVYTDLAEASVVSAALRWCWDLLPPDERQGHSCPGNDWRGTPYRLNSNRSRQMITRALGDTSDLSDWLWFDVGESFRGCVERLRNTLRPWSHDCVDMTLRGTVSTCAIYGVQEEALGKHLAWYDAFQAMDSPISWLPDDLDLQHMMEQARPVAQTRRTELHGIQAWGALSDHAVRVTCYPREGGSQIESEDISPLL